MQKSAKFETKIAQSANFKNYRIKYFRMIKYAKSTQRDIRLSNKYLLITQKEMDDEKPLEPQQMHWPMILKQAQKSWRQFSCKKFFQTPYLGQKKH